jgi:GrpB-like predicted nucleotidyltransferase (UPF0157 family)
MVTRPTIIGYDPVWPARFDRLAAVVRHELGSDVVRIDHIGSTSVPGLAAKDTIDIQVTVASLSTADCWPEQIGPFRRREICEDHVPPGAKPGADWRKRFWSSSQPAANLHVREAGRANQRYAVLFRDYLRTNRRSSEAYERAKRHLADLCDDIATYADAKDPICDLIMENAERWAVEVGWSALPR